MSSAYPTNLADLPKTEKAAIEEDKRRWFEARQMLTKNGRAAIEKWLYGIQDFALREDMRRRLNTIKENMRRAKRNRSRKKK